MKLRKLIGGILIGMIFAAATIGAAGAAETETTAITEETDSASGIFFFDILLEIQKVILPKKKIVFERTSYCNHLS